MQLEEKIKNYVQDSSKRCMTYFNDDIINDFIIYLKANENIFFPFFYNKKDEDVSKHFKYLPDKLFVIVSSFSLRILISSSFSFISFSFSLTSFSIFSFSTSKLSSSIGASRVRIKGGAAGGEKDDGKLSCKSA